VAGNAYSPTGRPEEQSQFHAQCKKASRRWRLPTQPLHFYIELYNSAPPSDTEHVGWFESETQAVVRRCQDKEELTTRDVHVLHYAAIRLDWCVFRTIDEYMTKVKQLNDFAATRVAPPVDPGDESQVDSDSDDEVDSIEVTPQVTPRKRTFNDIIEECFTDTALQNLERDALKAIKKRKQELVSLATEQPICKDCQCEITTDDQAVIPPCGTLSRCSFHAQCFWKLTVRPVNSHKCPNCDAEWNNPNGLLMIKGPSELSVRKGHVLSSICCP